MEISWNPDIKVVNSLEEFVDVWIVTFMMMS